MAVTSYKFAGTIVSETISGGNSTNWTNPSNAGADDTSYAVWDVTTASKDQGPYLKCTNFGFTSSDIPSGSTIDGIEVEYGRFEGGGTDNIVTSHCRAVKGGAIHSANVSTMNTAEWNVSTVQVITEGGASNLWGLTWADTDIAGSSTFGIAIAPNGPGTTPQANIDYVKVRVYYTEATGATIDAVTATYSLSGISTGLRASRKLAATTQAYSLTGTATGFSYGRKLAATKATYTLSGIAAALQASRKLPVTPGAFTLSGIATGLKRGYQLAPTTATYTLTGIATGLQVVRKLAVTTGTLTLTGIDATLTYTPAAQAYELVADVVNFTLTGISTAVSAQRNIAAGIGSYTLTGIDADLTYTPAAGAYTLDAEPGAFVLTGNNVDLEYTSANQEAGAPSVSKPSKYPRRYIYKDETYIVHDEREEYELERMVADDLASAQAQPVSPKRQSKINKQAKRVLKVARVADFVMEPLPYEVEGIRMLPAMQAITPMDLDSLTEEDEMMILMMMAA